MGESKKIVLFIVEGPSDETSLTLVLSKIIERDKIVRFKITRCDMTAENRINSSNIHNKITEKIKDFIKENKYKYKYKKSDILKVVHLVDTDGTFIENSFILQKDIDGFEYDRQHIFARNVEKVKIRNERKSQVINKLIGTKTVFKDLPYEIYFFSSNLEHVLHDNNNRLSDGEKKKYSHIFEDKFAEEPFKFIEFMNSAEFAVNGEYKHTWDFIKEGTNSLNRYTNFNILLNNLHK